MTHLKQQMSLIPFSIEHTGIALTSDGVVVVVVVVVVIVVVVGVVVVVVVVVLTLATVTTDNLITLSLLM